MSAFSANAIEPADIECSPEGQQTAGGTDGTKKKRRHRTAPETAVGCRLFTSSMGRVVGGLV